MPPMAGILDVTSATLTSLLRRNNGQTSYAIFAPPPPPNADPIHFRKVADHAWNAARAMLVVAPIGQVLVLLVFIGRVYTRMYPIYRFGVEDYLMSIAFVLINIEFVFQLETVHWAYSGIRPEFRTRASVERAFRNGILSLPFWAWGTGLIKISIALMLLKFGHTRGWRLFVYSIITLNFFFIAFMGVANIFNCTPVPSQWDMQGKYAMTKKCWPQTARTAVIYVPTACNVVSDIVLSLVPLTFLTKVQRPLREKFVIGCLLALGFIASALSIIRIPVQIDSNILEDPSASSVIAGMLTCAEGQVSFLAACVPMLRSSANRWLQRLVTGRGSSGTSTYRQSGQGRDTEATSAKFSRSSILELNPRDGITVTKKISVQREGDSSDRESEHFITNPFTGRIVIDRGAKENNSTKNLNSEWEIEPNRNLREEWKSQRIV